MKDNEANGNGAPFDETIPSQPTGTHAPSSSLISEINAPFDPLTNAIETERARCRAIVLKYFGSDWHGNNALEEIDNG